MCNKKEKKEYDKVKIIYKEVTTNLYYNKYRL